MRHRHSLPSLALLVCSGLSLAVPLHAADPPLLLRQPTVNQDQIVFNHASDLWVVPREGGAAQRLTAAVGNESNPHFSPDGKTLGSGFYREPHVRIWDADTGEQTSEFRAHNTDVARLAFSVDGRVLATTGGSNGRFAVWDVATSRINRCCFCLARTSIEPPSMAAMPLSIT